MKRVLILSLNYYPSYIGGAEVAIKEITNRIPSEEIEFHMITLCIDSELSATEKIGNVTVHRIGFTRPRPDIADLKRFPLHLNKYYFQIAAYQKACELHRAQKFDTLWAMMAHSCAVPAGLFKKKFPDVRYVLTLQEGDPIEHIEKVMKPVWPLFKQGFMRADVLQPISTFLAQWGMHMGFAGTLEVIPNGVDVKRFSRKFSEYEIDAMKEKLGKTKDDIYLVTTSRLVRKNGLDDVIRALVLLPEQVSFLIYGIGPEEHALHALAKEQGVEGRVRFMGQISHDEMPLILKACDVFVRPSRSEGMGNSFIEAMAAGLPVIATQEGGIADFLFDAKRNSEHPTTGWAVDVNSPEQIAEKVQEIIANQVFVEQVRQNALSLIQESYDWNTIAGRMKGLFRDTI